ncbi:MAG: rhomboid family intramembrane serine protease [Phycisphaerae bacterium]
MANLQQHEPLEVVFTSKGRRTCAEQALVLRAVGIGCGIERGDGEYRLVVQGQVAPRARAELEAYARETHDPASHDPVGSKGGDGWAGVLCYGTLILLVALCHDREVFGLDWFLAGQTNAELIRQGQWWRTVTALTLHADPPHLLGNLVVGGLFGLFAGQLLGGGLAWSSILVGGAGGNAINAWLRPAGHTSVGASTAIFAALGMVAACAWAQRRSGRVFSLRRWTPIVGGVVLLGYLGVGDARTDVSAHVAGFFCGLAIGWLYGKFNVHARLGSTGQALLATGALVLLAGSWALALMTD